MKNSRQLLWISLLALAACTTDPIIPPTYIIDNPPVIPIQDPGTTSACAEGEISFNHQVLPIMVSACAYSGCHDVGTAEDGVILDTYEHILKEVRPGQPNDSELYESITESDLDDIMPPPPSAALTNTQIEIIRNWILQGAKETDCGAPCDSTATGFSATILPILQDYCIGCHSSARSDGNVNIESYDLIVDYANNGTLLGTMRHDDFYPAMPPSGSKISDCKARQIENWIAAGALNN